MMPKKTFGYFVALDKVTEIEDISVSFIVEQSPNGTTSWSTLMKKTTCPEDSGSPNGTCLPYRQAHTQSFTPTQGFVRVKYSASAAFSLANATLNIVDVDTVYTVLARGSHRYAFQGQERDEEIKGTGNSYNYTHRMHDPRIGRFFEIDPLTKEYPHYSPYSFSGNRVIDMVELEGLEPASYLLKGSNVGKSFVAVSHATGQEGKIFYWKLRESAGAIWWEQRGRYQKPKPTPAPVPSQPSQSSLEDAKWASEVKLDNTLQTYSADAFANGNYGDWLYYKLSAWSSGVEGETGFKRKGIPIMVGTVTTILTMGTGGGLFGAGASGYLKNGLINGTGNVIGQYYGSNQKIGEIDGVSAGFSVLSGFIPGGTSVTKTFFINSGMTTVDAAIDYKINGDLKYLGNEKNVEQFSSDMFFGMINAGTSGAVQKTGVSNSIQNARNFVIGGTSQFMNGKVNNQLEGQ